MIGPRPRQQVGRRWRLSRSAADGPV